MFPSMPLAGIVPTVRISDLEADMKTAADAIQAQLNRLGFQCRWRCPASGARVRTMMDGFLAACGSTAPESGRLRVLVGAADLQRRYPWLPSRTTPKFHGWPTVFPDPKEFIHVSGAMLADRPAGAGALLRAFPEFGDAASGVFALAFTLISQFGEVIRGMLPAGTPTFRPVQGGHQSPGDPLPGHGRTRGAGP